MSNRNLLFIFTLLEVIFALFNHGNSKIIQVNIPIGKYTLTFKVKNSLTWQHCDIYVGIKKLLTNAVIKHINYF